MSYPVGLWGAAIGHLQPYTDLDGQVPEPGDDWRSLRWDPHQSRLFADPQAGSALWQAFLAATAAASQVAQQRLQSLQSPR